MSLYKTALENNMQLVKVYNEMLEAESRGVAGRLADLERKVLEQSDELMCLKATLAEALRRVSQLEGTKINHQAVSSPLRNGGSKDVVRLRSHNYAAKTTSLEVSRRSYGSSLPQRRAVHYQSTGSLHSDSHSSSSVSPVPSPSPRATPLPASKKPPSNSPSPVGNGTGLHKRWSSTGDFHQNNATSPSGMHSKFSAKSFLNLYNTRANSYPAQNYKHGTKEATFNEEEKTVKMYLRGRPIILYVPSELCDSYEITKVSTPPSQKLKLDWVYGYRGRDCRSNLYYLPTGEMVYFVAAVVVLYNVEEQSQRHYLGHTDDVKSLAIHPNKMLVATGQCAGTDRQNARPHIRVWNSVSLHTQAVIGMNDFDVSVCCLSFSKADGGSLLLAVDEAPDHIISIWEWQKGDSGHKVTETKCSVDTIVAAEFHPLDRNIIVTCGKSHIAFWSLDVGGTLYKRMGIFETRDKPKYVTCVAFLQTGETMTGDSSGNLEIWGRGTNTIWKFIKNVHEGPIFSICVLKDGSIVTGGGKDGRIVLFDPTLQKLGETQIEGHFGGIRVVSEGCGSQLIVGTTRNCILTGTVELGFQPIILGHTDELVALASHPSVQQFATSGYDKVLQVWDALSHSILWSKDIGEQAQSLAFSVDGTTVIVGCVTGRWMVFDVQTREILESHSDGAEPIQVIQCSPDGSMVALGSRDNNIYIYQVSEDGQKYNRVGRCMGCKSTRGKAMGHSSFVTHIDWSTDNQTLRTNSGDYELLYWNATTCRQIPQTGVMRDVDWATNNCTITFSTIGIWPENADGTDVNFCDRSHDRKLLASADDFGKVKLYSYPASQPRSLCHTYGGHSSHVMAVNFLHDDTRLVSIGGKDTAVLQWTIS
ncbi:echinoderm microtubule-associated protein-like 2 isoform X3 [Tribolium castaneum]|uniref:echinoderm microtubule-associated protein-like 2 isoform X3 n=1 Tax=Tribolium castaneum TaxID=7070 RepID=UPI00077DD799|nr:PREDICTED: echinoderm microtubule-associated protein-like 2 isoform X3 [Tribolium castaneum]|eukprot:XP_015834813.1 PREDICTED: echinoderm microtubule-associated protein-like 2 isoform X3 [Tribolium castaneum]